jgi:ribosome-binding protein aMBF1 (putative translation factor)
MAAAKKKPKAQKKRKPSREPQYDDPAYKSLIARVGYNLRRFRMVKNWSLLDVADACGIDPSEVQRLEHMEVNFTALTLSLLVKGLKKPEEYFFLPIPPEVTELPVPFRATPKSRLKKRPPLP